MWWICSGLATTCRGQVGILNKDIFQLTEEDLEPYDQVIFLAGLSNDPMAEYSPSKNFVFNAAAPAYLAYTAKNAKVKRYIYAVPAPFTATRKMSFMTRLARWLQLPLRHFETAGRASRDATRRTKISR